MQGVPSYTLRINCAWCQTEIVTRHVRKRFCGEACKKSATRKRLSDAGGAPPICRPGYDPEARGKQWLMLKADPAKYAKHMAAGRKSRQVVRDWLANYKQTHGCVDCGYNAHFSALQLDHEGEKSVAIADARTSIARLQAEIKAGQCKVRCANCHSIQTWKRKQPVGDQQ
jgi:hypothetical protein